MNVKVLVSDVINGLIMTPAQIQDFVLKTRVVTVIKPVKFVKVNKVKLTLPAPTVV
jgi:hypothetical protein